MDAYEDFMNYLKMILATLSIKERKIIFEREGITESEPQTLEEMGRKYGVTRERIRQIEAKAMERIRYTVNHMSPTK